MKISKRKDRDLYYANVRKPDGSYQKVYGKTKREVRSKYDELTEQVVSGRYVKNSPVTVQKWSGTWVENYFLNLKNSTIKTYKSYLSIHILPYFGKRKVQSIKKADVQVFVNKLSKSGLSASTVKKVYLVLHKMLNDAVSAELISTNPCNGIILPKQGKTAMEVLSEDEIKDFLDMADSLYPEYTDVYEFFLLTGLRVGELLGLTFDRYNPEEHSILIDRQLNKGDGYSFTTPKHDVVRTVYLSEQAEEIILNRSKRDFKLRKMLGGVYQNKDGFIFTTVEGGHLTHEILYRRFKRISKRINRANLRIHDLRHTFATMALKSGMDIKTLQTTLGHSDSTFTLNRYGHSTNAMQREAVSKYGEMFKELTQN